jgi:cytochrome c556
MRQMANPMYRDLNGMVKGEMPFDEAKATQAINQLSEAGAKISTAFPESSKGKTSPETRYSASPKVWTDKADFDARAARLVKAIGDNKDKIKTLDGLKAAYPAINDACNACHQDYRLRRG